ncbi:AbiV family abortive infection protein [Marinobacter salarius]|uniref:AbiV family abortive infection protein n=1 Tax=Marinobacter salarius TaxID=1420917 RepID=UPI0025A479A3|nr:AbiV family abortive infection protein [Marinobacter salarius]MDM8181356.1 AbiV family abortive infection protein [Marinobacter salarius]
MKKHEGLSKYKFKRLAVESLRNSIRLHLDSISLFEIGSYPSAFQLSVLALEEFSKSQWLEHYIYTAETNDGYPDKEFENKWLRLLYSHPEKQWAFIARDLTDFSPTFSEFVENGKLEQKKQSATYVSLPRIKGKVDIGGRISVPIVKIKLKDAKQLISFINSEFLTICWRIHDDEFYFDVEGMDEVFNDPIFMKLLSWPYKSRIRSRAWYIHWRKKWAN